MHVKLKGPMDIPCAYLTDFLNSSGKLFMVNQHVIGIYPFQCQFHKMVKHTQTIRRQFADELFECV